MYIYIYIYMYVYIYVCIVRIQPLTCLRYRRKSYRIGSFGIVYLGWPYKDIEMELESWSRNKFGSASHYTRNLPQRGEAKCKCHSEAM